ncbi:hypothetical protein ARAM_002289 [Aspergillus rambellii]|uniref:FAD-binding domain-containing protein n=1 Tax=Aspergillus rambellii TaxID=308745 RepID=A0A0F8V6I7_9EURO|nr:hypothetical protein ARAM_002289 [Aspergillus rambellii]
MPSLKVLIIGGSITGLTLANILERYGIEYTLFEKHDNVAPALGASLGILPHGARILSQLGCYDDLVPSLAPLEDMVTYGPDGKLLARSDNLGSHMHAMMRSKISFLERQKLLAALHHAVSDKSKLILSCKVVQIDHLENSVQVKTEDGRVFKGDLLVGADGVHSKTREQMWRMLQDDKQEELYLKDYKAIKSTFSCIFGISKAMGKTTVADSWKNVRKGRHYLIQGAPDDRIFWFLFFKNEKQAGESQFLRYTPKDIEYYATKFATDQIRPDMTFGELYENRTTATLVPLEEYTLNRYYHRRLILIGDSAHKMHPVTGQGGNAGIEDAAFLANRLKDLIGKGSMPTECQLKEIFSELQEERRPRTEMLTKGAHGLSRLETFDNMFLKWFMLHVVKRLPCENILSPLAVSVAPGEPLKYLPLPAQPEERLVPFEDEVKITPRRRSPQATAIWMAIFLVVGSLRLIPVRDLLYRGSQIGNGLSRESLAAIQSYLRASYLAIVGLWCLESYRPAFSLGPISNSLPFMICSFFVGWDVVIPIYLSLWIFATRVREFYYPSPRAIPLSAAKALPPSLATILSGIIASPYLNFSMITPLRPTLSSNVTTWDLAYGFLPVTIALAASVIKRSSGPQSGPEYQWGNMDIPYISCFLTMILIITSAAHLLFVTKFLIPAFWDTRVTLPACCTEEVISLITLVLLVSLWILFTAWDLRRVKVDSMNLGRVMAYIAIGTCLLGPGGSLVATWRWREGAFEKSRTERTPAPTHKA